MQVKELKKLLEGVDDEYYVMVYDGEYDDWFMTPKDRIRFEK